MNYLTNLFGSGNAAGGMRMPGKGQGMDLYSSQPSSNLGMTMPSTPFPTEMGTGLKPPASFGEMPTGGMNMQTALGAMQLLGGLMGQPEQQAPIPQMQMPQLPMGSNQSYEELLKMYGVRTGGLLG
jgi:hypothetical protein